MKSVINASCVLFFLLSSFFVRSQCDVSISVSPSACDPMTNFFVANISVQIVNPPSTGLALVYHEGYTHVEDLSTNNSDPLVINVSVPYLFATAQNLPVRVSLTDQPNCEELYTYQAPASCANVPIVTIECDCIAVQPWEYDYVCNDGVDNVVLIGEAGFVGVAWYNDDGDFISTDQDLVVTSNTPGMEDGSAYFYMDGINNEGMDPINCCRNPILVKQCPVCEPNDQVHVEEGDIYIDDACHGVILTAPNGLCYRMKVTNDGSFISEIVECPN